MVNPESNYQNQLQICINLTHWDIKMLLNKDLFLLPPFGAIIVMLITFVYATKPTKHCNNFISDFILFVSIK